MVMIILFFIFLLGTIMFAKYLALFCQFGSLSFKEKIRSEFHSSDQDGQKTPRLSENIKMDLKNNFSLLLTTPNRFCKIMKYMDKYMDVESFLSLSDIFT